MPRPLPALALLAALSFSACGAERDPADTAPTDERTTGVLTDTVTVDPRSKAQPDPVRAQALDVALDSLEALVATLARIEGPVAAWNRAGEAARLLRYLEDNRAAFALDMSEEEAARRYPEQIERLRALEARRTAELERIGEDPVAQRVLAEEMAKADAEARAAGR